MIGPAAQAGEDPRAARQPADRDDPRVRPLTVRLAKAGPPPALIVALMAVIGIGLFATLDANRRQRLHPPAAAVAATTAFAPPPPLFIPPPEPPPPAEPPVSNQGTRDLARLAPPPTYMSWPSPEPLPPQPAAMPPPLPYGPREPSASGRLTETALVVDLTTGEGLANSGGGPLSGGTFGDGPPGAPGAQSVGELQARSRAFAMRNQDTVIPQGALIPAVLETAIDSSRPGPARAIVSRDALGFDGRRVLVPRGSRLIGEYRSDAAPGQRRALVLWTRLIRPDGVTITLGSPAGDPQGRGGVAGQVDNHFFERFNGAILQSALEIGVNLASRQANSPVLVGIPGQLGGAMGGGGANNITPTIKVKPGAEVTIFVARDLDFTSVTAKP